MLSSTNQNNTIGACQLGVMGRRLLALVHHREIAVRPVEH